MVATWDDHELPTTTILPRLQAELQMGFAICRAIPQRSDTDNIWRLLSYGDVLDLFVLDCRTERSADQYVSPQHGVAQGVIDGIDSAI